MRVKRWLESDCETILSLDRITDVIVTLFEATHKSSRPSFSSQTPGKNGSKNEETVTNRTCFFNSPHYNPTFLGINSWCQFVEQKMVQKEEITIVQKRQVNKIQSPFSLLFSRHCRLHVCKKYKIKKDEIKKYLKKMKQKKTAEPK